jgi:hypothetical protein
VESIDRLQMQLDQLNQPGREHHERPSLAGPRGRSNRAALLELGRSMYRTGVVPGLNLRPGTRATTPIPRERCSSDNHVSPLSHTTSYDSNSPLHGANMSSNDGPVARTLKLGPEYGTHGISGYVAPPHGTPHPATAVMSETLDGNVISIRKVLDLGLGTQSLGATSSDGVVNLVFGPGNSEKSVGRVTLQWSMGRHPSKRYPPLTVECEVSESFQHGLIFGRPFLEARRRFWPKRTSQDSADGSSSTQKDTAT